MLARPGKHGNRPVRRQEDGFFPRSEPGQLAFGIGAGMQQPEPEAFVQRYPAAQAGQGFGRPDAGPAGGVFIRAAVKGLLGFIQGAVSQHLFQPQKAEELCSQAYRQWQRAVERSRGWIENEM